MIHIGERIKEVFEKQPKGHNIEWFAAQLHCHRANLYNIFSRSTIDTDLLFRISRILNHDFFRDLSSELNQDSDTQQEQLDLYNNLLTGMDEIIKNI